MSLNIARVVVASPDEGATAAAWQRLGVSLPVEIVPVSQGDVLRCDEGGALRCDEGASKGASKGERAGLVEVVLGTPDVAATAALLARRGLDVDGDLVTIAGLRWRLTEASDNEGVSSPPSNDAGRALRLDHVVVSATDATRAASDYGARLGLDLRLDRDTGFGFRGLFFRCGDAVVEVVVAQDPARREDSFGGLAWWSEDLLAERGRLLEAGVDVSDVRRGRKAGTEVATVRDPDLRVPTLLVGPV